MELKPCPFCGGEAEYHSSLETIPEIDENGAYVDCLEMTIGDFLDEFTVEGLLEIPLYRCNRLDREEEGEP